MNKKENFILLASAPKGYGEKIVNDRWKRMKEECINIKMTLSKMKQTSTSMK